MCDRVGIFVGGHLLAEGDIPSLSQKLFAGEPFVIEAHVDSDQEVDLTSCLQNINGVLNVAKQNRLYRMGCSKDVTPDIARAIVQSGVGLVITSYSIHYTKLYEEPRGPPGDTTLRPATLPFKADDQLAGIVPETISPSTV